MPAEYEPGTVAIATVRGVPNVRVMRVESNYAPEVKWASAQGEKHRMHTPREVTDVRPLVVLDPDACTNSADTLRLIANEDTVNAKRSLLLDIADQIEAQTKPPRIEEPGLWGVVEASVDLFDGSRIRRKFVHHDLPDEGRYGPWHSKDARWATWDELIDPVLVREGLS